MAPNTGTQSHRSQKTMEGSYRGQPSVVTGAGFRGMECTSLRLSLVPPCSQSDSPKEKNRVLTTPKASDNLGAQAPEVSQGEDSTRTEHSFSKDSRSRKVPEAKEVQAIHVPVSSEPWTLELGVSGKV